MITHFNPDNCKAIREILEEAVAHIKDKHGVSIRIGGIRYKKGQNNNSAENFELWLNHPFQLLYSDVFGSWS